MGVQGRRDKAKYIDFFRILDFYYYILGMFQAVFLSEKLSIIYKSQFTRIN